MISESLLERVGLWTQPGKLDISPRQRLFATATQAIAAATENRATATQVLNESPQSLGDGIIIDYLGGELVPTDTTAKLTLQSLRVSLLSATAARLYSLGQALITTLTPAEIASLLFTPLPLVTFTDLVAMAVDAGAVYTPPLSIALSAAFLNTDAVNPHTITVNLMVMARLVRGLKE